MRSRRVIEPLEQRLLFFGSAYHPTITTEGLDFLTSSILSTINAQHAYQDSTNGDIAEGLPIVVLVNGDSASAAEIVAAALQDSGRAVVVGSNSYGKGTVQTVLRMPNDGELTLTVTVALPPNASYVAAAGLTDTEHASTSTRSDPLVFLYVALTSTAPSAAAVTRPDGDTVALAGADDCCGSTKSAVSR